MNNPSPLEAVFFAALEKGSAGERIAYLNEVCACDADLRQRVEKMLAAQAEAGSFLEIPVGGACLAATNDQPIAEYPGMTIGPYKLLEQIGEGGFGVVFMAEQQQPVRRKVALKVLKPGMDTRQVVARFEAERQALALMDHPNIAHVFDGGTVGQAFQPDTAPASQASQAGKPDLHYGRPYFVMELVHGAPITEFCDQSCLGIRERLALFVDVCQAVQHAHQKGIIHRDIKPTNVMVTLHDGQPVVKVIDFGIAKALGQQLTEKTLFTNFAQMIGTPLYMSPEQAEMSGLDVDTRSDVYSLGVLLYELLTGTTPFENERLSKVGYDEMRRIIREEEPPKPSARISTVGKATTAAWEQRHVDPRKLSRLFRGELDWIVMKALEKDRNRRYETASGLAADVRHYLDDEPVLACPPSASYRLRKFAHRNKVALGVTGLVLFFLLLMGSGLGWALRDRAAREAELATETASRRARLNGEVEHVLNDATNARDEALTPSDDPHELEAAVNKAEYILQRAKGLAAQDETAIDPSIREGIESLQIRLLEVRCDVRMLKELEDIRLRPADSKNGEMWDWAGAEKQYAAAFAAYGLEPAVEPEKAAEEVRKSPIREALLGGLDSWLQLRKEQPAPIVASAPQPARRDALPQPGGALDSVRAWLRAVADAADDNSWRRAVRKVVLDGELKKPRGLASDPETLKQPPHVLARLGSVLDAAGLRVESETILRQAQERYPGDFWINYNLGHLLIFDSPARPDEAIGYFRAAVAIRPRSAEARSILGLAFHLKGDNDRAVAEYQQAITLDPRYAIAHNNLGVALRLKGRLDEAIAEHREALRLKSDFPDAHYFLGLALVDKQQIQESIEEFSKCLEMDPKNVQAWVSRARAFRQAHQFDNALADFDKAVELEPKNAALQRERDSQRREKLDANLAASRLAVAVAPTSASAHCALGDALLQRGIFNEAEVAFEKAVAIDPELAVAHCGLGRALLYQADFEQAVTELRRADELDPTLIARCELAEALVRQGRMGDALAELHSAIELKPTHPSPYRHLAWHLATCADLKYRNTDKALELAQKIFSLDPQGGWQGLGSAEYCAGKWSEAVADLTKAMEIGSGGTEFTCLFLAMAHWQLGSRDVAREWYDRALRSRENRHLDESQRFQLEAAELLGINDDPVRTARARLDIRHSRWTEATQEYARMANLVSADDVGRWFEYTTLHLLTKDMDGYRRLCTMMADEDALAGSAIAKYELARACALNREPVFATDHVVRWAQPAAALGARFPWHLHVLGLAYYRDGQFQLAVETLHKSLEAGWQYNGTGALNEIVLAMAHHRLGHPAIAQRFFERAERRIRQIDAGAKPVKMPAPDWLEVQVLLPEAESLLKAPATETGS